MPTWNRVFFRSAGFGAGFAAVLCVIGGLLFWYETRPKPPKPWNKQAITAEYDFVEPQGDKSYLTFYYMLQNNTDSDYRVDSSTGINITGKLKREQGLTYFAGRYEFTDYPIFVPAKNRVRFTIHIPFPYLVKEKDHSTTEEHQQYLRGVEKYVADTFQNLDGFVVFDTLNRYEIDCPIGWEQRATQASASK